MSNRIEEMALQAATNFDRVDIPVDRYVEQLLDVYYEDLTSDELNELEYQTRAMIGVKHLFHDH